MLKPTEAALIGAAYAIHYGYRGWLMVAGARLERVPTDRVGMYHRGAHGRVIGLGRFGTLTNVAYEYRDAPPMHPCHPGCDR